jgi:hypothetical protein
MAAVMAWAGLFRAAPALAQPDRAPTPANTAGQFTSATLQGQPTAGCRSVPASPGATGVSRPPIEQRKPTTTVRAGGNASFAEPPRLPVGVAEPSLGSTPAADTALGPDNQLLQLLLQEHALLENFGPDHPQVKSLRDRIALARAFIAERRAQEAAAEEIRRAERRLESAAEDKKRTEQRQEAAAEERRRTDLLLAAEERRAKAERTAPPPPPVVVVMPPTEPAALPAPTQPSSLASPPPAAVEVQPPVTDAADAPLAGFRSWALRFGLALLAATLLSLVLHVVALICNLRRRKAPGEALKVELINATPSAVPAAPKPAPDQNSRRRAWSERKPREGQGGPTGVDEAIFRQLVDQNRQLRADIATSGARRADSQTPSANRVIGADKGEDNGTGHDLHRHGPGDL